MKVLNNTEVFAARKQFLMSWLYAVQQNVPVLRVGSVDSIQQKKKQRAAF